MSEKISLPRKNGENTPPAPKAQDTRKRAVPKVSVTAVVIKYPNGNVLRLIADGKRPIQFGQNKAAKYAAHMPALREFANTGKALEGYSLSEFKGHPIIILEQDRRVPVSIGRSGASLIVAAEAAVLKFAAG